MGDESKNGQMETVSRYGPLSSHSYALRGVSLSPVSPRRVGVVSSHPQHSLRAQRTARGIHDGFWGKESRLAMAAKSGGLSTE